MQQIDFHILKQYLRSLAENHAKINHFVGFNEKEFHTLISKKKGPEGVLFVPFKYEGVLKGNHQRTMASRIIHFTMLQRPIDQDYESESIAIAACEAIGLSVLSRINYDSQKNRCAWLYDRFDQNSVQFNELKLKSVMGLVGMEFSFELSSSQPLVIDVDNWGDLEEL